MRGTPLAPPTQLGMDADAGLRRVVGYLKANGSSVEEIVELLATSI